MKIRYLFLALALVLSATLGFAKGKMESLADITQQVKNAKGDEKTFVVTDKSKIATTDKVAATLADLKVGDKVKVDFTDDAGKLTATKITPPPVAKAHEAKTEKK